MSHAVINYLVEHNVSAHVVEVGAYAMGRLRKWQEAFPGLVVDVRGKGLLLAFELKDEQTATRVSDSCLEQRVFVRQTRGNVIRIFPALTITRDELDEGLSVIENVLRSATA